MGRVDKALEPYSRVNASEYDPYECPTDERDVSPNSRTGTQTGIVSYDPYDSSDQSPKLEPGSTPEISVNGSQAAGFSNQFPHNTQKTTSWRIHWRAPTLMIGLFFVGIFLALGHHFYYQSLNGTLVSSSTRQEWAIRIGTAFAFLTHASLVASAGTAYVQRLWVTVKRKQFRLEALDNIFSLQSNPFSFLSWEVLSKAKILWLLGLFTWCLPISSVITPATLSVHTGFVTDIRTMNVPFPDYSDDMWGSWANFEGNYNFNGPTPEVARVVAAALTSMEVLPITPPHANSSFTLQFHGPSFKCQNTSTAVLSNFTAALSGSVLQDAWDATMEDKISPQIYLYIGAAPELVDSYRNASDLRTGALFFNTARAGSRFGEDGSNYTCYMWNTSYTVDFSFQDDVQSAEIQKFEQLNILEMEYWEGVPEYSSGQLQSWVVYRALAESLVAEVGWGPMGQLLGGDSGIVKSAIAACPEMKQEWGDDVWFNSTLCRAGSIPGAIEDLSRNVTLSILSSAALTIETAAEVTVHNPATFYSYNWRNLVLAYAISICVTAVCVAVGLHSLLQNGYSAGTSFSSILLTTRNADLDELARGHCLGESPLAKEVGDKRLRYGLLGSQAHNTADKVSHAGFGSPDGVRNLKRGEPCW